MHLHLLVECVSSQLISALIYSWKHSDSLNKMNNISGGKKRKAHFPEKQQFSCLILVKIENNCNKNTAYAEQKGGN